MNVTCHDLEMCLTSHSMPWHKSEREPWVEPGSYRQSSFEGDHEESVHGICWTIAAGFLGL